jgi:hypothetical protein
MTAMYAQKMDALANEKLSIDLEAKQKKLVIDVETKQKKLALKQKEEKIKEEILSNLTSILKAQNPFELDLETFLGGVIFVASEMKVDTSKLTSSWQQKGAEELNRFHNRRRTKAKATEASKMDQKAA